MAGFDLDGVVRKVPDFPTKGILYYDITSILMNPTAFSWCLEEMFRLYSDRRIEAVAGVESRGFLLASPFAKEFRIPLILIRKSGKLPGITLKKSYQLEYGKTEIEVHSTDIPKGANVLLVDDLLATGGTMKASLSLLREGGAHANEIFSIVALPFLNFANRLPGIRINVLIAYDKRGKRVSLPTVS